MHSQPGPEHKWLGRMVGEWTAEIECRMGPDQPPMKSESVETVRSLGGLWVVAEGRGEVPDGGPSESVMTLGFDSRTGRFVGTFVASMMDHLWVYNGTLDADGRVLTLDCEGPSFTGEGLAAYQDIVEFVSDDHRILRSQLRGDDGRWIPFMTAHYRRKA